jgi:hypothetical protein
MKYFLNMMGPVNATFIKKYGIQWKAGRIDYGCDDDNPYGREWGVPCMHFDSWNRLAAWLVIDDGEYESFDQLIDTFEVETGVGVVWLVKEDYDEQDK